MPINYDKWKDLDVSDSDEEQQPKKAKEVKPVPVKAESPKDAVGSAWNSSNYHWEEQKLDEWGRTRFRELITADVLRSEFSWNEGLRLDVDFTFGVSSLDGEAWTHIRKGKSVLGYNFEVQLTFVGKVTAGSSREEEISGVLTADVMVDNRPDVDIELKVGNHLPFAKIIVSKVSEAFNAILAQFVSDLDEKARNQQKKVETQSPIDTKTVEDAPKATVIPKSHFGGRVQVGGHNPEGLRLA